MIDARTLKPGDAILMSCPDNDCTGDHLGVVLKRKSDSLDIVWKDLPMYSTRVRFRGTQLVMSSGALMTVEAFVNGVGVPLLDQYTKFQALVAEAHAHEYDEIGFDLAKLQFADKINQLLVLGAGSSIMHPSGLAYGLIRIAGVEPTAELVVLICELMTTLGSAPTVALVLERVHDHTPSEN